jgi:hypothetical protein
MWTAEGYHKDVVFMSDQQIHMGYQGTEPTTRHIMAAPIDAVRAVIDPKMFPEAVEFEVIIQRS